jgi:NAD-dependent deacetylase sirtuin 4
MELTKQVDNLHPKAASLITCRLPPTHPKSKILELHGTLARVHCLAHRHEQHRDDYQTQLGKLNPVWQEMSDESERTGNRPRTNPDGDVRSLFIEM